MWKLGIMATAVALAVGLTGCGGSGLFPSCFTPGVLCASAGTQPSNSTYFLYAVNSATPGSVAVSSYDTVTNELKFVSESAAGNSANAVAVTPDGTLAYVCNLADNSVSIYTIDSARGSLTPVQTLTDAVHLNQPRWLAVSASGRFLYVVNYSGDTIITYQILSGGTLAYASSANAPHTPRTIAFNAAGTVAYVPSQFVGAVSSYTVDTNSGGLTLLNSASPAFSNPVGVAIDPLNRFVFEADPATQAIGTIPITNPSGLLGAPAALSTPGAPNFVTLDPTGSFLYSADFSSHNLFAYGVDPSTGVLTPINLAIPGGTNTSHMVADPAGKFVVAVAFDGSIRVFAIEADGDLTLRNTLATADGFNAMALVKQFNP